MLCTFDLQVSFDIGELWLSKYIVAIAWKHYNPTWKLVFYFSDYPVIFFHMSWNRILCVNLVATLANDGNEN